MKFLSKLHHRRDLFYTRKTLFCQLVFQQKISLILFGFKMSSDTILQDRYFHWMKAYKYMDEKCWNIFFISGKKLLGCGNLAFNVTKTFTVSFLWIVLYPGPIPKKTCTILQWHASAFVIHVSIFTISERSTLYPISHIFFYFTVIYKIVSGFKLIYISL